MARGRAVTPAGESVGLEKREGTPNTRTRHQDLNATMRRGRGRSDQSNTRREMRVKNSRFDFIHSLSGDTTDAGARVGPPTIDRIATNRRARARMINHHRTE